VAADPTLVPRGPRYAPTDPVDFVIVGAGAAGSVVARQLARAGFRIVVLEQGPFLGSQDFRHDELGVLALHGISNDYRTQPNTFQEGPGKAATTRPAVQYGRLVGGGTAHFTANYWRFHEIDFIERSVKGPIAGTGFDDWPITYADLEPYYTMAEWELGVSGLAGASPFDPPRSKPYPMPPLPIKSIGVLAERGARKLGWHAFASPMAITSVPYQGRPACQQCGFCEGFGCEYGAKSSPLPAIIPQALATGKCEIRPGSYVRKIETDASGRVTGVKYFDADRKEVFQRARAVVVCANGAETPKLLLMSKSNRFPDGLANSSGVVGKYFMPNGGAMVGGLFEHEVNGYKGTHVSRVIHDFYQLDPKLGLHGGGGIDTRWDTYPTGFGIWGMSPKGPQWGREWKQLLRHGFNRSLYALSHTTCLPLETNRITLDPDLKDAWGLPALRLTYGHDPRDLALYKFFEDRAHDLLVAAGATRTWGVFPLDAPPLPANHLLGTCRMGNDPKQSVTDKFHRAHDVPNLYIVSGASFVTSGRGQPTETIQALAFRAGELIGKKASG
jgi:choline dehydrogenase-like flavoprotein